MANCSSAEAASVLIIGVRRKSTIPKSRIEAMLALRMLPAFMPVTAT